MSVRPDSGSDSPSPTVLTTGVIPSNSSSDSLNYVGFSVPVNVTANAKYWFTLDAYCRLAGTCSSVAKTYAIVYRSDGRPTAQHYETSNGVSWSPAPLGGSLNFVLAASTSPIKSYNTKAFYNEIKSENDQSTAAIPAQGWNSFLGSEQSGLMSKLRMLLSGLTGQQAYWYTGLPANVAETTPLFDASTTLYADSGAGGTIGCPPSVAACGGSTTFWAGDAQEHTIDILSAPNQTNWLPWSSFGTTYDNRGDLRPADISTEYLVGFPLTARSILSFNDWSATVQYKGLENMTQVGPAQQFGTLLNRMQVSGGYFGSESAAVKVLWIGTSEDGLFPQYLTPAAAVTFVSSSYPDQNLTYLGDLSQFNVVIGGLRNPTPSFSARLASFISRGGGYVATSFGSSPGSADGFLGLQSSSTPASVGGPLTIVKPNKITSPYTSIYFNPYWLRYTVSNVTGQASPAYVLLRDNNGNPVITTHAYGSGIAVSLEQPYARLSFSGNSYSFSGQQFGSPRDSWVSLMINAIFYAAHKGGMLPILWETSYSQQQPWSPLVQFSVDGSPGKPVLVWASNNDTAPSPFDVHLNASFYGISTTHWFAMDIQNMSIIASGSGSDIHIRTTIPPKSWLPIYILSDASNLQPLYSTASILSSSQSGGFTNYVVQGAHGSSTWLVLKSSASVLSVLESANSSTTLQSYSSLQSLNASLIGDYCSSILSGGTCNSFTSYAQQGWFYDAAHSLLYLHFQMGSPVTISVSQSSTSTTTSSTTSSSSSDKTTSTSSTTSITSTTTSSTSSTYIPSNSPTGLDGTGSASLTVGTRTASLLLTTTSPNDVIIVQDAVGAGGADCTGKDTISDSASLVWHYRAHAFAYANQVEEWWAVAPTALSDTITTSFCTYEYGAVVAFGIAGANTASPFDLNPSLPQVATGGGDPGKITISTTSPSTMILGVMSNLGSQGISAPDSFSDVYNNFIPWTSKDFTYRVVSSPQSNYAVTWGNTENNAWIGLVDAVALTTTTTTTSSTSSTQSTSSTYIPSNSPTGLDGTGSASLTVGTRTASLLLTTTSPNDVIIVQDAVGAGGADCTGKDTISDSAHLVWTYRAHSFASGNQVEEWYAVASGVLSSDTITTSFCTYEYGAVVAFGIAGANTASPFDLNPSLPQVATGGGDPGQDHHLHHQSQHHDPGSDVQSRQSGDIRPRLVQRRIQQLHPLDLEGLHLSRRLVPAVQLCSHVGEHGEQRVDRPRGCRSPDNDHNNDFVYLQHTEHLQHYFHCYFYEFYKRS